MKTLCLARHAKAQHDASLSDAKRALTERGCNDAVRMGQRLRRQGCALDLILTSPALRTRTTAQLLAKEIHYDGNSIGVEKKLYDAGVADIVRIVRGANDRVQTLMLVGHNPGMHEVIEYLTGQKISRFPPAGICIISLSADSWDAIDPASGSIVWLSAPREAI